MSTTTLLEIDVDQLEPDPENVRSQYDPDVIGGLAAFFKEQGSFIENPVVWLVGALADGRPLYRAFSGSTRAQAARSVGGKIIVQVLPQAPAGSGKLLGQLAAGLVKGELNPVDISRALRDLQQEGGRSVQDLVRELADWGIKRSRSWVFQHLHLADLVPEVQAMIGRAELPVAAVNALYNKRPDDQLKIATALRDGTLRLSAIGGQAEGFLEAVQGEINQQLADAAALVDGPRPRGRRGAPAEQRHGPVQSRRLLLGLEYPVGLPGLRWRAAGAATAEEWAPNASEEERALALEAAYLGKRTPDEALKTVAQWEKEAETAPDEVLMAAHGLKRVLDLCVKRPESLAEYPGLLELLELRATTLTHIRRGMHKHRPRAAG